MAKYDGIIFTIRFVASPRISHIIVVLLICQINVLLQIYIIYMYVYYVYILQISEFVSHAAMRGNLGPDFSTSFEISWSRMHTPEGKLVC